MMEEVQVCRVCGRTLPLSKFERFRSGTYRRVCNQCKWVMYIKPCIERKRQR